MWVRCTAARWSLPSKAWESWSGVGTTGGCPHGWLPVCRVGKLMTERKSETWKLSGGFAGAHKPAQMPEPQRERCSLTFTLGVEPWLSLLLPRGGFANSQSDKAECVRCSALLRSGPPSWHEGPVCVWASLLLLLPSMALSPSAINVENEYAL